MHSEAGVTPRVQHGHQLLLQVTVAGDERLGQWQLVLQDQRHAHLQEEGCREDDTKGTVPLDDDIPRSGEKNNRIDTKHR